jgi:hypothetical protein
MRAPLKYREYALSTLIATEMLANGRKVTGGKVKRKAEDPPVIPPSVLLVHIHEARVRSGGPGNATSETGVERISSCVIKTRMRDTHRC